MEASELERYFDKFIASDSTRTKEENKDPGVKSFFQLLPDELLMLDGSNSEEESAKDDYSSQNPTAAELPRDGSLDAVSPAPDKQAAPQTVPEIQNVISTVKLGCSLDLDLIACKSWNVEYNPKIYKALVMRIREPRATALIYKNGNLVCTGAKSVEQSLLAARKFARIVQKLGFPVASLDFKIRNMVATCSTFPVCLDQLATSHHQLCSYEPELFPGLFYKIIPGVNVTVFPSGKINMCGAKTLDNVYEAFHALYPILRNFRRK